MKLQYVGFELYLLIIFFIINLSNQKTSIQLFANQSSYYEEKYFRILSNNYDIIEPGNNWILDEDEGAIGFKAKKDFGSLILLKDWSMYDFKLIKVLFKKECSFEYEDFKCSKEMWLIHSKNNEYYPPGRRIFIKQNYFILVVPFLQTDDDNPAIDSIFEFCNLKKYMENLDSTHISPQKPIKLYQIIQNQPSYLFEAKYNNIDSLFMVFTQYHFIKQSDNDNIQKIFENKQLDSTFEVTKEKDTKIYRNMKHSDELKPKVSLMAYNNSNYLKNYIIIYFLFLILIELI